MANPADTPGSGADDTPAQSTGSNSQASQYSNEGNEHEARQQGGGQHGQVQWNVNFQNSTINAPVYVNFRDPTSFKAPPCTGKSGPSTSSHASSEPNLEKGDGTYQFKNIVQSAIAAAVVIAVLITGVGDGDLFLNFYLASKINFAGKDDQPNKQ